MKAAFPRPPRLLMPLLCIALAATVFGLAPRAVAQALTSEEPAAGAASISPKHLLILRPGVDALYGTYVFAVQNPGTGAVDFESPVMLPREANDFMPQEGLEPDNLKLVDGRLLVKKTLPGGVHIMGLGFRIDSGGGQAVLTLMPPYDLPSLTVLVPKQSPLGLAAGRLTAGTEADPQYLTWELAAPLMGGESLTINVEGIPEGRGRLWFVGGLVFALIVAGSGVAAWRTRPRPGSAVAAGAGLTTA